MPGWRIEQQRLRAVFHCGGGDWCAAKRAGTVLSLGARRGADRSRLAWSAAPQDRVRQFITLFREAAFGRPSICLPYVSYLIARGLPRSSVLTRCGVIGS